LICGTEKSEVDNLIVLMPRLVLIAVLFLHPGCVPNTSETYLQDLKSDNVMVQKEAIYKLGETQDSSAVEALSALITANAPKFIKIEAMEALGKIGEERAAEIIIPLLKDDDQEIREAAIEVLGKLKSRDSVPFLIAILPKKETRLTTIWALGNIGDKTAIPVLATLLKSDDKFVRYNASRSLQKIGGID